MKKLIKDIVEGTKGLSYENGEKIIEQIDEKTGWRLGDKAFNIVDRCVDNGKIDEESLIELMSILVEIEGWKK